MNCLPPAASVPEGDRTEQRLKVLTTKIRKAQFAEFAEKPCRVCGLNGQAAKLEWAYVNWEPEAELSARFGLTEEDLKIHILHRPSLRTVRRFNTPALYEQVIARNLAYIDNPKNAKSILHAATRLDAINGRGITTKIETNERRTVLFVKVPEPGGVLDAPKTQLPASETMPAIPATFTDMEDRSE